MNHNSAYEKYLAVLRGRIRQNNHLIGVVAGNGITAKYAVMGGCDMLLALNSGRYRTMGCGSLAGLLSYCNSNDMVMDYACKEVLRFNSYVPVFFGLNATDPTKNMYEYISNIKKMGFSGINNYPTVGMIDGQFRTALESEGISYQQEIEAISFAHYCGLITIAFVFTAKQAEEMAKAGADIICAHFGLTKGGFVGPKKVLTLESARRTAEEIFNAAEKVRPEIIKMVYGGPVKTPIDAQYMYQGSQCHGYIGGSVFDRVPVESALFNTTKNFVEDMPMTASTRLERILFATPGQYDYIEFIKEFICENYMNKIYLHELAHTLHLSPPYLSSLFKKEVGQTFQSYLLRIRMDKAKDLIGSKRYPLVQVAQMVGYNDYAQFSKIYKKTHGVSPREDLQNIKKAQENPLRKL